uniref:Uncharacterized protein n=1 Tax=Ditylenchus dipsaci TaxID=166011 RepID=A0A915CU37_9BILA
MQSKTLSLPTIIGVTPDIPLVDANRERQRQAEPTVESFNDLPGRHGRADAANRAIERPQLPDSPLSGWSAPAFKITVSKFIASKTKLQNKYKAAPCRNQKRKKDESVGTNSVCAISLPQPMKAHCIAIAEA